MKVIKISLLLLCSVALYGQGSSSNIIFNLNLSNKSYEIGDKFYSTNYKDSIKVEIVKFYVSNLLFFYNGEIIDSLKKKHILIDFSDESSSNKITFDKPNTEFNQITFQLGIDSSTNVSGALGEDLDPTKGMYWTWQSGYINFKLEGTSKVCPSRNNFFQFHLGGYQHPFQTIQNIRLKVIDKKDIEINVNIEELIEKINLKELYQVMSPSKKAVEISSFLPLIFTSK